MGKLRALKLGIIKGVAHAPRMLGKGKIDWDMLTCTQCGHGSKRHNKYRPPYTDEQGEWIGQELLKTARINKRGELLCGFPECTYFICEDCQGAILSTPLDGCACKHE